MEGIGYSNLGLNFLGKYFNLREIILKDRVGGSVGGFAGAALLDYRLRSFFHLVLALGNVGVNLGETFEISILGGGAVKLSFAYIPFSPASVATQPSWDTMTEVDSGDWDNLTLVGSVLDGDNLSSSSPCGLFKLDGLKLEADVSQIVPLKDHLGFAEMGVGSDLVKSGGCVPSAATSPKLMVADRVVGLRHAARGDSIISDLVSPYNFNKQPTYGVDPQLDFSPEYFRDNLTTYVYTSSLDKGKGKAIESFSPNLSDGGDKVATIREILTNDVMNNPMRTQANILLRRYLDFAGVLDFRLNSLEKDLLISLCNVPITADNNTLFIAGLGKETIHSEEDAVFFHPFHEVYTHADDLVTTLK